MALTRRELLFALPLCAGMVWSCTTRSAGTARSGGVVEVLRTQPANPAARTILVCMPETAQTKEVWKGLNDELSNDYRLVAVRVESSLDARVIAEGIKQYQPSALVLVNNPTVAAYRDYQANTPVLDFPPAVVVMSSFLERHANQLISTTGVSYEVPLITVMTNLRRLITLKSERVGVVVRAPLREFVRKQVELAVREQVHVHLEHVSAEPNPSEIKRALRALKEQADVLW